MGSIGYTTGRHWNVGGTVFSCSSKRCFSSITSFSSFISSVSSLFFTGDGESILTLSQDSDFSGSQPSELHRDLKALKKELSITRLLILTRFSHS